MSSYAIMTNLGRNKEAAALATGATLAITSIAWGEGDRTPGGGETSLQSETGRKDVQGTGFVADQLNAVYFEIILGLEEGPFVIREAGLFDVDGDLIAVAKYDPHINKPLNTVSAIIRINVVFSDIENLVLRIESVPVGVTSNGRSLPREGSAIQYAYDEMSDGDVIMIGARQFMKDVNSVGDTSVFWHQFQIPGFIPSGTPWLDMWGPLRAGSDSEVLNCATDWLYANSSPNRFNSDRLILPYHRDGLTLDADWNIKAPGIAIEASGGMLSLHLKNGASMEPDDSIRHAGVTWHLDGMILNDAHAGTIVGNTLDINGKIVFRKPPLHIPRATRLSVGRFWVYANRNRAWAAGIGVGGLMDGDESVAPEDEGTIYASELSGLITRGSAGDGCVIGGLRDTNTPGLMSTRHSGHKGTGLTLINARGVNLSNMNVENCDGMQAISIVGGYAPDDFEGAAQQSSVVSLGPAVYMNGSCSDPLALIPPSVDGESVQPDMQVGASDKAWCATNQTTEALIINGTTVDALKAAGFTIYQPALVRAGVVNVPGTWWYPDGPLKSNGINALTMQSCFQTGQSHAYRGLHARVARGALVQNCDMGLSLDVKGDGGEHLLVEGIPGGDVRYYGNRNNLDGSPLFMEMASSSFPPKRPMSSNREQPWTCYLRDTDGAVALSDDIECFYTSDGMSFEFSLKILNFTTVGVNLGSSLRVWPLPFAVNYSKLVPVIVGGVSVDRDVFLRIAAGSTQANLVVMEGGNMNPLSLNELLNGHSDGTASLTIYVDGKHEV